jgi:hypothetical protein
MKRIIAAGFLILLSLFPLVNGWSDEPKYHDKDLILDEARVPAYDLPPLLVSSEAKPISTPEEWFNLRRPQIMALLGNLIYGIVPSPESSIRTTFEVVKTDRDIDAKRIAIMGHSKMGKATLWTAAQDPRFALASSAQSGCGGAALWKRNFGENMEKMVTRFPYWRCRNAGKFVNNEDDLPIDQHMLLACIAPWPPM